MGKQIISVGAFLSLLCSAVAAQDFEWPTAGTVTQEFYGTFSGTSAGQYWDENNVLQYWAGGSGLHRAIDIGAPSGTPVNAARDGTVVLAGNTGNGYGIHVVLDHGGGYFTLYAHFSLSTVSAGDTVATGDLIGEVGMTGTATGNHLHFEVRYTDAGGAWSYSVPRYYIPAGLNDPISAGAIVSFDYPNLSALASGGTPPPPGGGGTPPGGSTPPSDGIESGFDGTSYPVTNPSPGDGEGRDNDHFVCGASSADGLPVLPLLAWLILGTLALIFRR